MKHFIGLCCLLVLAGKLSAQQVAELPYAVLNNMQGRTVTTRSISDFDNPIIVITYSNVWCEQCVKMIDDFDKSYASEGAGSGVKLVAINVDKNVSITDIKTKAARWRNVEVLSDGTGDFMKAMYSTSAPKIFFLDANQKVVYTHESFRLIPSKAYQLARKIKQGVINGQMLYFDSDWFPTEKENANYFRKIEKESSGLWSIRDYYINGDLQMSGYSLVGAPEVYHGEVKYYYLNNELNAARRFNNGKLHGMSKEYENGKLVSETEFSNGKEDGYLITYYASSGKVKEKGLSVNGLKTGKWQYYFANGNPRKELNYKNDKLDGISKIWDTNGTIIFQGNFIRNEFDHDVKPIWLTPTGESRLDIQDKNGLITLDFRSEKGLPILKVQGIKDENNFELSRYTDGKVTLQATMSNEKTVDGKYITWHYNGQKKFELTLWDNKPAGKAMAWYENGKVRERIDFDNNVFEYFDNDGNRISNVSEKVINLTSQSRLKTDHLKKIIDSLDDEIFKLLDK